MVHGLTEDTLEGEAAVAAGGRGGEHLQEGGKSNVERAACAEQPSPPGEQAHRPTVDLVVAPQCRWHLRLALGERRWVDHDEVEATPLSVPVGQSVKGV